MSTFFCTSLRCRLPVLLFFFQGALQVFFLLFVTYDEPAKPASQPGADPSTVFSLFHDFLLMLLVGLGLLLVFMKGYGIRAVAFNVLMAIFATQWALVVQGFVYHYHHGKVHLGLYNILTAEFAAVAVLISAGAILGHASSLQLLLMALCEVLFYVACEWLVESLFQAEDAGRTITLHVFACYFGLGTSFALYRQGLPQGFPKENPSYLFDLLSVVGTMILWVFWPTFIASLVQPGEAQRRAVLHTRVTLSTSALTSAVIASLLEKKGRLILSHVQNSMLAGGVAIGALMDMAITPTEAFVLGVLSSQACILGFKYMTPFLAMKTHVQDPCGIHSVHGLPGIIGAMGGIVAILLIPDVKDGLHLRQVFPPQANKTVAEVTSAEEELGRTASQQALMQAASLGSSFIISLVGGYLTGLVLKLPSCGHPPDELCFDGSLYTKVQGPRETLRVDQASEDHQPPPENNA